MHSWHTPSIGKSMLSGVEKRRRTTPNNSVAVYGHFDSPHESTTANVAFHCTRNRSESSSHAAVLHGSPGQIAQTWCVHQICHPTWDLAQALLCRCFPYRSSQHHFASGSMSKHKLGLGSVCSLTAFRLPLCLTFLRFKKA